MRATKISYSITRQVRSYEPTNFTIEAELCPGDNVEESSKFLQKLAIEILYRDKHKERDFLIESLVNCTPKTETELPKDLPKF